MKGLLCFVVVLLAGVGFAQGRATLVDAPLDVRVPMPDVQVKALQSEFRQALARSSNVLVPTSSSWKQAIAALRRQDCDVRNECLRQLAVNANSLYALFASLERNAAGTELTATGRIVNQDGRITRNTVRLTAPAAGPTAALDALKLLLQRLEIEKLPGVLSAEPVAAAPAPADTGLAPPPFPLPEVTLVQRTSPARVAAWVTLSGAIASAGVSAGFGFSAAAQLAALPADGRLANEAQAAQQRVIDRSATIALGAGIGTGVLLVTSVVLFSASSPVTVAALPSAKGGTVVVAGRF
ncbi:MAG: hypothetical protein Q8K32_24675 [Archangium sp.]|nr:hypothetical protein [Archangium sp.]